MDGGEWGFKEQTKNGSITPPASLTLPAHEIHSRIQHAQSQKDGKCGQTFGAHCGYWDGNHPGEYEHWRFENGWRQGFDDALAFFGARANGQLPGGEGGDKIGFLDLWVRKRILESGQAMGPSLWEWESGFRQGVKDLYELVGV